MTSPPMPASSDGREDVRLPAHPVGSVWLWTGPDGASVRLRVARVWARAVKFETIDDEAGFGTVTFYEKRKAFGSGKLTRLSRGK